MKVIFQVNEDAGRFDDYVRSHPNGSMYQSSGWSLVKREWQSLRLVGEAQGKIVCSAQILIRKFPLGQKLFYIPRGPLWSDDAVAKDFIGYIKSTAKKQGAFCVKFDPLIIFRQYDNENLIIEDSMDRIGQITHLDKDIVHKGFEQSLNAYAQPRFNAYVFAGEQMADRFSSSTKRNIKTAIKKNVHIGRFSREKLDSFANLMSLTEQRKNVSLRNFEYFSRFFDAFESQASLFIAGLDIKEQLFECESMIQSLEHALANTEFESNQVKQQRVQRDALVREQKFLKLMSDKYGDYVDIGGLLILIHDSVCEFLYSGMNAEFSKYYPAYLMRLRAMEFAKEQGCTILNFGGIPGTTDDGLWEFKRSFGAVVTEYIGEFDLVVRPTVYRLFDRGLPYARKMMHKLRKMNK